MADRVATFSGVMIRPGVSKNNRLYTTEAIGKAVARMQDRLSDPNALPITMYGSHGEAHTDSAFGIAARITKVTQADDGSAHFEADVPNTALGRDMASMLTAKKPYLGGVSIRGRWMSPVTTVEQAGAKVQTADDMDIMGLDFTNTPGVEGAKVHQAALAESAGSDLADLLCESIEDTFFDDVTLDETDKADDEVTTEVAAADHTHAIIESGTKIDLAQFIEAFSEAAANVAEAGDAPGNGKKPYGNVTYADPGYQGDKKKRYPIDSAEHVRAAWSYINQSKNAGAYSSSQLSAIKGRIKSAAKKFGIDIAAETAQLEADILQVLEAYASMCVDNGGGSVSVSGYTDDAGKLAPMAQRIALATLAGLNALDPDADGDIDLGNGDSSSSSKESAEAEAEVAGEEDAEQPDHTTAEAMLCPACENSVPEGALFCPTCAGPLAPAESKVDAVTDSETEAQVADETTTEAAATTTEESTASTETAEAVASPAPTSVTLSAEQFATLLASVAPKPVEAAPAKESAPAEEAKTETIKEEKEEEVTTTEEAQTFSAAQVQEMLAAARKEAIDQATSPERQGFVNTGSPTARVSESAEGPSLKELSEMNEAEMADFVSESVTYLPQWGGLRNRLQAAQLQYATR